MWQWNSIFSLYSRKAHMPFSFTIIALPWQFWQFLAEIIWHQFISQPLQFCTRPGNIKCISTIKKFLIQIICKGWPTEPLTKNFIVLEINNIILKSHCEKSCLQRYANGENQNESGHWQCLIRAFNIWLVFDHLNHIRNKNCVFWETRWPPTY